MLGLNTNKKTSGQLTLKADVIPPCQKIPMSWSRPPCSGEFYWMWASGRCSSFQKSGSGKFRNAFVSRIGYMRCLLSTISISFNIPDLVTHRFLRWRRKWEPQWRLAVCTCRDRLRNIQQQPDTGSRLARQGQVENSLFTKNTKALVCTLHTAILGCCLKWKQLFLSRGIWNHNFSREGRSREKFCAGTATKPDQARSQCQQIYISCRILLRMWCLFLLPTCFRAIIFPWWVLEMFFFNKLWSNVNF